MLDSIKEVDELNLKKGEMYKIAKKRAEMNVRDLSDLLNRIPFGLNADDILNKARATKIIDDFNHLNTLSPQTVKISTLIDNYNEIATSSYQLIDKFRIKERASNIARESLEAAKSNNIDQIDERRNNIIERENFQNFNSTDEYQAEIDRLRAEIDKVFPDDDRNHKTR